MDDAFPQTAVVLERLRQVPEHRFDLWSEDDRSPRLDRRDVRDTRYPRADDVETPLELFVGRAHGSVHPKYRQRCSGPRCEHDIGRGEVE